MEFFEVINDGSFCNKFFYSLLSNVDKIIKMDMPDLEVFLLLLFLYV